LEIGETAGFGNLRYTEGVASAQDLRKPAKALLVLHSRLIA